EAGMPVRFISSMASCLYALIYCTTSATGCAPATSPENAKNNITKALITLVYFLSFFPDQHQSIADGEHNRFHPGIVTYKIVELLNRLRALAFHLLLQYLAVKQHIVGQYHAS